MVEVRILDAAGRIVPLASNMITFAATGPGAVIGVGNGDPSCHEPDRATQRSAFNGLCAAIVQAKKEAGTIQLVASAPGLPSATVAIECSSATPRPSVP